MSDLKHLCASLLLLVACDVSDAASGLEHDAAFIETSDPGALADGGGLEEEESDAGSESDAGRDGHECRPGQTLAQVCGLNGRGESRWICVDGRWQEEDCHDPDECTDGEARSGSQACGLNGRGYVLDECVNGTFVPGPTCVDSDECVDGGQRAGETVCGYEQDGRFEQRCEAGQWGNSDVCLEPVRCETGAERPGNTFCGLNGRGTFTQKCEDNHWLDSGVCSDRDVCVDGSGHQGATPCGLNGRGGLRQKCTLGKLVDTAQCTDIDECQDGKPRERANACGVNGRGTAVDACVLGHYGFDHCQDADTCRDGEKRGGATACGLNGRGRLTELCTLGGWADTAECKDVDACTDTTTRDVPNSCGLNGRGSRRELCVAGAYVDQGQCADGDECVDGSVEKLACERGEEGERTRTCTQGRSSVSACACADGMQRICDGTCKTLPAIVHVRAAASAQCQDGRSFDTAFSALEDAFKVTRAGTEVWVAEGTYASRDKHSFRLPGGARLLGGFAGHETRAEQRDVARHKVVLDGSAATEHTLRTFTVENVPTLIDGVEFSGAKRGALMAVRDLDVRDCTFTNNTNVASPTPDTAGAISFRQGKLRVMHSSFVSNRSFASAGAIYAYTASNVELRDSLFQKNGGVRGGAVYVRGNLQVRKSAFTGNYATDAGGALFVGMLNNVRVMQSWFEGNFATNKGGAMFVDAVGTSNITNSMFWKNFCAAQDCIGGALSLGYDTIAKLAHVSLVENKANAAGGGIHVGAETTTGTLQLTNSLLSGNTAPKAAQLTLSQIGLTLGRNLVEGGVGQAQANVLTVPAQFVAGSLELAPESPGIDFGSASDLPADTGDLDEDGDTTEPLPVDIAGRARAVGAPDVGAFERQ